MAFEHKCKVKYRIWYEHRVRWITNGRKKTPNNPKPINPVLQLEERGIVRMIWGEENQYIHLLFSNLPYVQNQCSVLEFHTLSIIFFFFRLVLAKLKCIIPGGLTCPIAKLRCWLNIVAQIILHSSNFDYMSVRKVFEWQT